jgi:hypothetical protein
MFSPAHAPRAQDQHSNVLGKHLTPRNLALFFQHRKLEHGEGMLGAVIARESISDDRVAAKVPDLVTPPFPLHLVRAVTSLPARYACIAEPQV